MVLDFDGLVQLVTVSWPTVPYCVSAYLTFPVALDFDGMVKLVTVAPLHDS